MADHGTAATFVEPDLLVVTGYQPGTTAVAYGAVTLFVEPPLRATASFNIGGTLPCPEVPGPPTTGQLWPRGNP